jgi:chorismate mutase/prephenate dehydratase
VIQTASTAGGARDALADPRGAAIGSSLAGELLGLPVLRERIQDRTENATRFVMIAKEDGPKTGDDKTTLGFSLHDGRRCGALRRVLEIFDSNGVNLTRIESRPSRQRAWDYVFLVDLDGHRDDGDVARVVSDLSARCESVTLMGSYPRYRASDTGPIGKPDPGAGPMPATTPAFGGSDDHCCVSGS